MRTKQFRLFNNPPGEESEREAVGGLLVTAEVWRQKAGPAWGAAMLMGLGRGFPAPHSVRPQPPKNALIFFGPPSATYKCTNAGGRETTAGIGIGMDLAIRIPALNVRGHHSHTSAGTDTAAPPQTDHQNGDYVR